MCVLFETFMVAAQFQHGLHTVLLTLVVSCAPQAEVDCGRALSCCMWLLPRPHQLWQNVVRGVILGVSVTLDYWNMLVR